MTEPEALPRLPDATLQAQLATARAQVRRSLLPVALAHALVAGLLWRQGVGISALAWWLLTTGVNAARSWHGERLARQAPPERQRQRMGAWLLGLGLLEAVPLLLLQAAGGSPDGQYLVTMILLGLTVGGVSNLAGQLRLYLLWALPLCVVLVLQWAGRGDAVGLGVATLVALLFGLLGSYVRDYGTILDRERRLAEDLRQERDRAKAAVLTRSQFFMAASHDLRQPLGAIRWYGEAVAEHARLLGHDTLADIGSGLLRAVDRTEPMLAQYLEIGQLDARADAPEAADVAASVDLAALLRSLCDEWQPQAQAAGLALHLALDAGLAATLPVRASETALRRVLDNLLANALKFTPAGTVTLSVHRPPALDSAPPLRIAVYDTGIGIAPEHLPHLFNDFYQALNPSRSTSRGVGLGLGIARRHAERLGVQLQVESTPGQGSRFWFDVPQWPAAPGAVSPR